MTVPSTTSAVLYVGTGSAGPFPYTWGISSAADLVVYTQVVATGGVTQLINNLSVTSFTVSGVGIQTGGNVTLTANGGVLPIGTNLFIASDPAQIQPLLLQQGANFSASDLMNQLDYMTREIQATRRVAANAFQIPMVESLAGLSTTLPPVAQRALKTLGFDSSGNVVAIAGISGGGAVSSALVPVVTAASLGAGRIAFGDILGEVNTIAALKALATTDLTGGQFVRGYYAAGDGGAGTYFWNSSDSRADNGGSIIQPNSGGTGRWNLLYSPSINIRQWGAKSDGTDCTTIIANAVAALGGAGLIDFPANSGNYTVNSLVTIGGNSPTFRFLPGATASSYDNLNGPSLIYSNSGVKFYGNVAVASGGCGPNGGGFLIGGTGYQGAYGTYLSLDANPAWSTLTCSKPGSDTELTIQPNSFNGFVNTSGTAVTWVSGAQFVGFIGSRIYINNVAYVIQSVNSATSITLTSTAGTQTNVQYQQISLVSSTQVNTNGLNVTWVSGELFAYFYAGNTVKINGTSYTVNTVAGDGKSLTLTSTAGVQTNVAFVREDLTSFDASVLGLNKQSGLNEERVVFVAKAFGEYRMATVATGLGQHYPITFLVNNGRNFQLRTDGSSAVMAESGVAATLKIDSRLSASGKQWDFISKTTGDLSIYNEGGTADEIVINGSTGFIQFQYAAGLKSYAKASLPSAANFAQGMIWVPDDIGGSTPAFSDGTNWRRVADRNIIS